MHDITPNALAYLALLSWPVISIWLYRYKDAIPATFWTIVGGYLILPVGTEIDLPLVPSINKISLPAVCALVGCRFMTRKRIVFFPSEGLERKLFLLLLPALLITAFTNPYPIVETNRYLPGLTWYDGFSMYLEVYLSLVPFVLAVQLVRTVDDQILLFKLFLVSGLLYSSLALFEVRMSPQLHAWVYGYFPHNFLQHMRGGGFRPMLFMGHGLLVAIFYSTMVALAAILFKVKERVFNIPPFLLLVYMFVVLVFCRSVGALVIGFSLAVIIVTLKPSLVRTLALGGMLVILFYPGLRTSGLIPIDFILDQSKEYFGDDRHHSLSFRIIHEESLLNRAKEKIMFGWGSWGRNTLEDSITDGRWIITLGAFGIVGFVLLFGLLVLPAIKMFRISGRKIGEKAYGLLVFHSILLVGVTIDQLPNSSLGPWIWFLSGGLLGVVNHHLRPFEEKKGLAT